MRQIFDDDEPLLDYGSIDELSALGIGDRGFVNVDPDRETEWAFSDQFERRSREIERRPPAMHPVNIVPMKNGPWSGSNQLGIERSFAPAANNEQTILKLDEWGFPEVWTVTLGLVVDPDLIGTDGFSVIAKVNAGVGGTTQEFEVDWHNGATFSCTMNALNVIAFYEDPVGSLAENLRLRVSIGRKPIASALGPTRTKAISALAGASGDPIVIPPFATRVTFMPNEVFLPPTPPSLFYDPANIVRFQRSLAATDGIVVSGDTFLSFPGGIPIPNGARTMQFFNGTAVDLSGQAVFGLCL